MKFYNVLLQEIREQETLVKAKNPEEAEEQAVVQYLEYPGRASMIREVQVVKVEEAAE